jgi:hypothetical protein
MFISLHQKSHISGRLLRRPPLEFQRVTVYSTSSEKTPCRCETNVIELSMKHRIRMQTPVIVVSILSIVSSLSGG